MKTTIQTSLVILCSFFSALCSRAETLINQNPKFAQPVSFKENLGQVSDQNHEPRKDVLFSGTAGNLVFHLKNNGISYQLNRIDSWKESSDLKTELEPTALSLPAKKEPNERTIYRVDINWLNTNLQTQIKKEIILEGYDNYYLSPCLNGALQVKSYGQITYQQIYEGIDLKWYSKNGQLKYDYNLAVGADYKHIQFEIKGAEKITVTANGELRIETPLGVIVEQAPLVIQNKRTLPSKWKIKENIISFEIKNVDPSLPFVIDPAVRVWGTFYGAESYGYGCSSTENGDVYMAGTTGSGILNIATTGAHQITYKAYGDAFLVKFNAAGARLWCTYYGGSNSDGANSCTTDTSGNVYMVGSTSSFTDAVIASVGAHQTSSGNPNGGGTDLYLVKFNASGIRQWATYYGGDDSEYLASCTTDVFGNVFVSGQTKSANSTAIATNGSHQSAYGGGLFDAFLAKFNSSGTRQWATYYGGTGSETVYSCLTDSVGNSYISGTTKSGSSLVMSTPGSYQSTFNSSGANDIYLVKFNSSGVRQWGTYYGGPGEDACFSSCIDKSGNVFLTGHTNSQSGIATPGAFLTSYPGSGSFLAKFNNTGSLQWGTYYTRPTQGSFSATDKAGDVVFGGNTNAFDDIATAGSHQQSFGGGITDLFITKFSSSGALRWGTFYGGNDIEDAWSCTIDNTGNVFVAGTSQSNNDTAIATPGSYQPSFALLPPASAVNAFLVKLKDTVLTPVTVTELKLKDQTKWSIYPNPTSEQINLMISDEKIENNYLRYEIVNSLGMVCLKGNLKFENLNFVINTGGLPEGCYVLNLSGNSVPTVTKKIVIGK